MSNRRKITRSGRSKAKGHNTVSAAQSLKLNCDLSLGKLDPPKNPLMIELVLVNIFNKVDTDDLVRCSAVSKLWLREARKILRDERKCFAKMSKLKPCEDLQKFSRMLAAESTDLADLPYTGLFIPFDSTCHWRASAPCLKNNENKGKNSRDDSFPDDVVDFKWKYLHVKWVGPMALEECPGARLIPYFVTQNYDSLKEIQLENLPDTQPFFLWTTDLYFLSDEYIRSGFVLPKLKIVRGIDLEETHILMTEVCRLVDCAPNLDQLLIPITRNELRQREKSFFIRPERYNVVKSLCFSCQTVKHAERFEQFAATEPTLRHLIVKYPSICEDEDDSDGYYDSDEEDEFVLLVPIERCWAILQNLLRSSTESLEKLRLPATVAVLQMDWPWQEFPNLTFLALEIPFKDQKSEQLLHRVMRRYNFTARFPKLTSITVDDPHDNVYDPEDRSFRNFREIKKQDLPSDTTVNIKTLTYNGYVTEFGFRYLRTLFPHVTAMNLGSSWFNKPLPYGAIWKEWPQLESLSVSETFVGEGMLNYDAEFLGIYEAEAEILQKMDPEQLKTLNIVPVKPAITHMDHLRELTVSFINNPINGRGGHLFLSPAGCILTVNRMPHLKFKLILCSRDQCGASALKKYVEVEESASTWE